MAQSKITKGYKKLAILYTILSWTICFAIATGLIVYGVTVRWTGDSEMSAKFQKIIGLIGTSLIACVLLALIVKDKIKPLIWMANIILSAYLFSDVIMFAVFGVWVLDTYVITNLAKYYRTKHSINKEIDKRT